MTSTKQTLSYTTAIPQKPHFVYQWHARPGAINRLLPPWQGTEVIHRSGGLAAGAQTRIMMPFGPFKITMHAEHTRASEGKYFEDQQVSGPFRYWNHHHQFSPTSQGCLLEDQLTYQLPINELIPQFIDKHIKKELFKTFCYREKILLHDLARHQQYSARPLKVLITGASGALGKELCPFLTSGGHTVYTLVRRPPTKESEFFWNPELGRIDDLPQVDVIIHLAGEYIGLSRWNKRKKEKVIQSRIMGTRLLVKAMKNAPPKVFLSSSAIGYYGNNKSLQLAEDTAPGAGFLADVCRAWEKEALVAEKLGIRTVILRLGVVLGQRSGALKRMLSAAKIGFPKSFGKGTQYTSWLGMNDCLAALLHCMTQDIEGPVNIVSPYPLTNRAFFTKLAQFGKKPLLPAIPELYLKILYGEMAQEIALASSNISPQKLVDSSFVFWEKHIDDSLTTQLGAFNEDIS